MRSKQDAAAANWGAMWRERLHVFDQGLTNKAPSGCARGDSMIIVVNVISDV